MNWKERSRRIHRHFMRKMAIGLRSNREQCFLALALGGEVGELQNLQKKQWRDGAVLTVQIAEELADIRIYLEHLADSLEIDLDATCEAKVEHLLRERWPEISDAG